MFTVSELNFIRGWANKIRLINEKGGKCEHCGDTNIFHLTFHHIDEDSKDFNISVEKKRKYDKGGVS